MNRTAKIIAAASLMLGVAGCADNTGNGALIGGAAGAGIGAIIGNNSHGRTGEGALIGGAVGAAGGALAGHEIDKNQRERDYNDGYYDRGYYDAPPPPSRPPPPPPPGYYRDYDYGR